MLSYFKLVQHTIPYSIIHIGSWNILILVIVALITHADPAFFHERIINATC